MGTGLKMSLGKGCLLFAIAIGGKIIQFLQRLFYSCLVKTIAVSMEPPCKTCGVTFEHSILSNIHSWSHVSYEETPNFGETVKKCAECNEEFDSFDGWKSHALKKHVGRSPFACLFCSLTYVDLKSLTNHVLKFHPSSLNLVNRKAKFLCPLCALAFCFANALCHHLQSSHSSISLILIDKDFYPASETHFGPTSQRRNTPKRPILRPPNHVPVRLKNQLKKVAFVDNDTVDVSKSIIESVKKYRCGFCGSTFQHCTQLEIHRKQKHKAIISGVKPKFGCGCCAANFYGRKYMKDHMLIHHNIQITPKKLL